MLRRPRPDRDAVRVQVVLAGRDVVTLLAALVRERFGTVAQLEAEDHAVRAWRRHVLHREMPGATRRGPRTRLHRPRLLLAHLEREPRPWESREAWIGSMWDGRAA